jgi:hypothetical protein
VSQLRNQAIPRQIRRKLRQIVTCLHHHEDIATARSLVILVSGFSSVGKPFKSGSLVASEM